MFYDDLMDNGRIDPRARGSNLAPWSSPTFIGGNPHNLPTQAPQASGKGSTVQNEYSGYPSPVVEAHRYASVVDLSIAVGLDSVKFLDQPIGKRNFLMFRNAGASTLYIGFGGAASTNSTLSLAAGALILFDTVVPQDDLYVIGAAATTLSYAYSTYPG